ncbi:TetR/AcrR family transcriptional regulator [Actinoplanes sp. CA-030573]|uniref:TetR/AcrR family transcriptional regulator n=1 Tax=Actinoplanes sp. CA-030573 TaxID=3239898 RepID=UPI003D9053FE
MTPHDDSIPTPALTRRRRNGDLAAVLLAHGVDLARAGGPEAVSLREVQRRAGVSHAAAYRHYADREALLAAISSYAKAAIYNAMNAAQQQVPSKTSAASSPAAAQVSRARFDALGRAYLDFALTEPGLFHTAFLPDSNVSPTAETPDGPTSNPYHLLMRCLDDMVDAGALAPERRPFSDVAALASVHGLAVLLLDGPLRHLDPMHREAAIKRTLDIVSAGTK